MTLDQFLDRAWQGYVALTPDAPAVQRLLRDRGEAPLNDHVALRTFDVPGVDRAALGRIFERWGYVRAEEELDFPEKKLKAHHYAHPEARYPKVFISELLLDRVSPALQAWLRPLAAQAAARHPAGD